MKARNIVIVTAITGNRDQLRADQYAGGTHIAFVDRRWPVSCWQQREAYSRFKSNRMNARIHKVLVDRFVQAEYSLWIDGNVALRESADVLVERWLRGYDIAVFRHRTRECIYDEGRACVARGLDSRTVIQGQLRRYRAQGYPAAIGLAETTVVLRRHSPRVELFNQCWWGEMSAYSVRDQLSFNYAAWRLGVKVNYIEPVRFENTSFDCISRPPTAEIH